MINDCHCHFFSQRFFELLSRERGPVQGADPVARVLELLEWDAPGPPAELADRWVKELDENSVARAAMIASLPGDQDSVAAAVAAHPDRFVGFFMVDPTREGSAEGVRRSVVELGLRCICLFPAMHHFRLDGEAVGGVFEVAASAGAAVFVHCGVLSVGVRKKLGLPSRFDLQLAQPLALSGIAQSFPQVTVIIPHFGAGLLRETLMLADQCPNVCLDTSSSNGWIRYDPGLTLKKVFALVLDVVGPDRILFGTDSSFFPRGWQRKVWESQSRVLDELKVGEEVRHKIMAENFNRLFPPGG